MADGIAHLLREAWFVQWLLPSALAFATASWRAMSREGGPTVYSLAFKRDRVPREDRAVGFDLLFAALASQLGFMAQAAKARTPMPLAGAYVAIGALVLFWLVTRFLGYEDNQPPGSRPPRVLKLDLGVTIPNYIGIGILILVYNWNT